MFREIVKFSAFMTVLFLCTKAAGVFGLFVLIVIACFFVQYRSTENPRSNHIIMVKEDLETEQYQNYRETQGYSSSYCYSENEHPYDPHISSVEKTY